MARAMSIDSTNIYRLLVTQRSPDGLQQQSAYGPYELPGNARHYDGKWSVSPARLEKQKLDVAMDGETLVWATIKTTYTNGGEEVEWDG